jgi:hypothetical protein
MTTSGAADDAVRLPYAADVVRRYLAMLESGAQVHDDTSLEDLEGEFVRCAAAYGTLHGLSFADWRGAGVGAEVLWRAGISGPGRKRD